MNRPAARSVRSNCAKVPGLGDELTIIGGIGQPRPSAQWFAPASPRCRRGLARSPHDLACTTAIGAEPAACPTIPQTQQSLLLALLESLSARREISTTRRVRMARTASLPRLRSISWRCLRLARRKCDYRRRNHYCGTNAGCSAQKIAPIGIKALEACLLLMAIPFIALSPNLT